MHFRRNERARLYTLRLRPDGTASVTVPKRGTKQAAVLFLQRHAKWLERQWLQYQARPKTPACWPAGTTIFYRGRQVPIVAEEHGSQWLVRLDDQAWLSAECLADWRPWLTSQLRLLAHREFPRRVAELAAVHQLEVTRVVVRDQRSRWGSCSRRRTISLNWRLVQAPAHVLDYIIHHELMHLRELNHSPRFWKLVARACPDFQLAETWLRHHSLQLLGQHG